MPHLRNMVAAILFIYAAPSFAELPATSTLDDSSEAKGVELRIYEASPSKLDTSIYGQQPFTVRPERTAPTEEAFPAPQHVSTASVLKGTSTVAEGQANLRENNRVEANVLESAGAAMTQRLPAKALRWATAPKFEHVEGFKASPLIGDLDFSPNREEVEFLLQTSSPQEFAWKAQTIRERRAAQQSMRDNPITSFVVSALDPGYLVLGFILILGICAFLRRRKPADQNSGKDSYLSFTDLKVLLIRWGLRIAILFGAFSIHWAFGVFMCFSLYAYLINVRR